MRGRVQGDNDCPPDCTCGGGIPTSEVEPLTNSAMEPFGVAAVWLALVGAVVVFWVALVHLVGWAPLAFVAVGVLAATVTARIHQHITRK